MLLVSRQVKSNSSWPCGMQQARLPCPSPPLGVCPNSCPLNQWCHPNISSSLPSFLLPSIFPSIRVFFNESAVHIRWPKYWSFSFSISPSNEYSGLIPFKINCLTSLLSKGLKSFLQHHSLLYGPTLTSIHDYWTKHSSDYMIFVCKVMSLLWKRGMEIVTDFIFLGSNIAEDSDWRHKLKDAYSLEEKLWQT